LTEPPRLALGRGGISVDWVCQRPGSALVSSGNQPAPVWMPVQYPHRSCRTGRRFSDTLRAASFIDKVRHPRIPFWMHCPSALACDHSMRRPVRRCRFRAAPVCRHEPGYETPATAGLRSFWASAGIPKRSCGRSNGLRRRPRLVGFDVERFANLETGQAATVDAPLAMSLIAEICGSHRPARDQRS
jgi:hypothetical protein